MNAVRFERVQTAVDTIEWTWKIKMSELVAFSKRGHSAK